MELIGTRLYTGPMFMKYNTVLRFFGGKLERDAGEEPTYPQVQAESLGLGKWITSEDHSFWRWENTYATTIHAVNSCVLKLSKLMRACHVYRGFAGARLPAAFWRANEDGVCGVA